jgi:hypothetical protein
MPGFGAQVNSAVLWVALEDVLEPRKALSHLERLDDACFTPHENAMKSLLDMLREVLREPGRKFTWGDRARLRTFLHAHPQTNRWSRKFVRRVRNVISQKTGQGWVRWAPL